jgi:hypothetical protein
MSDPVTDPSVSVLVPLPSDLARTIDTLAERRGQDRAQFIVSFLRERLADRLGAFWRAMATSFALGSWPLPRA